MAIALAFVLTFVATGGSMMADYAWQEAQWEEFEAAQRAAVAAMGTRLGDEAEDAATGQRLTEVLQAMQPGYSTAAPTIVRGADDVVTVTFAGTYAVEDFWSGEKEVVSVRGDEIRVKFEHERYEIAMALDISGSMNYRIELGGGTVGTIKKIDALKQAVQVVTDALQEATNRPGTLMVSLVPYASAVNVADTATAGTDANGATDAKRRYVRMLAGAQRNGTPLAMPDVLRGARADAASGFGQWVDTFHRYGVGSNLGNLRSQGLPADLLSDQDWNLRRTDVQIPVGMQLGHAREDARMWAVDDEDFWNGCLMARWGAYWDPSARPVGFRNNPVNPDYWPVVTDVAGWSSAAPALSDLPLHLSDAPPDRGDRHTLFTAYSWPDASISGPDADARSADHKMQVAMARLLDSGTDGIKTGSGELVDEQRVAHNDWTMPAGGGHAMCPTVPIRPLSDDVATFRNHVAALSTVRGGLESPAPDGHFATIHVRGLVWALRTLSPLWQPVWDVEDTTTAARPGVPCAAGEGKDCDPLLNKSIIIVADGQNDPGFPTLSWLGSASSGRNAKWPTGFNRPLDDSVCGARGANRLTHYHAAWANATPRDFNQYFQSRGVALKPATGGDEDYRFDATVPAPLLDAFRWHSGNAQMATALAEFTPWEVFRGPEPPFGRDRVAADALMDPSNGFALEGRPTGLAGYCGSKLPFSPYGSFDEHVLIGELGAETLPPAADVGPLQSTPKDFPVQSVAEQTDALWEPYRTALSTLDDWFVEACRIAGDRGVRVHGIYIGNRGGTTEIALLERCVDAAGGDPDEAEVFVTPTGSALKQAIRRIFAARRNLRFLG